ncbi:MAG: polysulfide reductase NrfD, partial [Planctomycetes bacterium]|nr:polysulfide reductase NrfD [Planctomycetota bacterium]
MFKRTRLIKDLFWFFALFGLVAGVFRLWFGLGSTTNLSDEVPWGLWKILNMVGGVALSTSGFTVGFLVVVLKLERFRPLLKPAILVAFLGYGASCCALLFDIGLPQRFWHPLFMWNEHSFLFEVFWCVLLYFTVTLIELTPNILERFNRPRLVKWFHRISFGVVVTGISLSSLHHSSLGSIFLVTPQRLHPLWYSSMLPLFFILSAMGAGLMVVVLVRILYARWYDPEPVFGLGNNQACSIAGVPEMESNAAVPPSSIGREMSMLSGIAKIAVTILSLYLLLKASDLIRNGAWRQLFSGTWESHLFMFENLLSVVIPLVLVALPRTRRTPFGLGIASLSAAAGLALNRLDVGIMGYFRDVKTVYFPSLAEWAVGIGVMAAAGLVFFFVVENFSIFDDRWKKQRITQGFFKDSYGTLTRIWNRVLVDGLHRVTFIAVLAIPLAWIMMYPPFMEAKAAEGSVRPSVGQDAMRTHLRIDGNRSGVYTDFPHAEHQQRLGDEASCSRCHHLSYPGDKSTPCFRCHRDIVEETSIFDHSLHMHRIAEQENLAGWFPSNHSCRECHDEHGPKTAETAKSCMSCHKTDMFPGQKPDGFRDLKWAAGYQEAMHSLCISCHREKEDQEPRKGLG